jgi:hypothetical protein
LQEREQLKARLMRDENLPLKSAQRAVKLIQKREWIFKDSTHPQVCQRKWTSVDELLQYEFCTLTRWTKQLETLKEAQTPEDMSINLCGFIDEVRQHAKNFNLSDNIQKELSNICKLSEKLEV